jgi:2-hydroxy-6-oxonona-2,4-dienedioate hydrolase
MKETNYETKKFCKMTLIFNVLIGLIGLIILVIFGLWVYFLVWRNNAEKNLPKNSIVFESLQGAIEYHTVEDITNPVLVLHGTPGSVFVNILFEDIFSDAGLSMVSVSRPGYYKTPLSSGKTLEGQSKLYKLLLDKLGIESLFVFGISGGGPAAIQFALDYPERCKGVILAAAVTQKLATSGLEEFLFSNEFLLWLSMQGMTLSIKDKEFKKKMRPYFKLGIFPFKFASQGYYNDNITFNDLELDLTALEVPVLLIHGTMDKDVPFSFSEDAHQKIPNSTLIQMDGIGHPDVLNNEMAQTALNEFVRKY